MYRALLIERPKRSTYRITHRGRAVLEQHPKRVDLKVLSQFEEFVAFKTSKPLDGTVIAPAAPTVVAATAPAASEQTPEEQIDAAHEEMRTALAAEVIDRVRERSPDLFEQLVLDVLRGMGYGGPMEDAGQHLGQSGDEGVDGVIREDELGLDLIYLQAKRWAAPVGRPEIQKFFGALHGKRATKGVFITTSYFTKEAIEYADSVTPRVILVDGQRLARLMVAHNVGVTTARCVEIKRLDLDYFATDEDDDGGSAPAPSDST